jgi:long-chain fatty acid transport protein
VNTPVPDVTVTPLLPDQNRQNIMLGAGIPLGPTWTLDAAYMYVNTQGRRGRIVNRTSETQTAAELNTGWYQLSANILSVSLKAEY